MSEQLFRQLSAITVAVDLPEALGRSGAEGVTPALTCGVRLFQNGPYSSSDWAGCWGDFPFGPVPNDSVHR